MLNRPSFLYWSRSVSSPEAGGAARTHLLLPALPSAARGVGSGHATEDVAHHSAGEGIGGRLKCHVRNAGRADHWARRLWKGGLLRRSQGIVHWILIIVKILPQSPRLCARRRLLPTRRAATRRATASSVEAKLDLMLGSHEPVMRVRLINWRAR